MESRAARVSRLIEGNFLVLAVLWSGLALVWPPLFTWIAPHISLGLGVIMFGMGVTLELKDFAAVARRWPVVVLALVLQYTIMPLAALFAARLFGLPPELAVGVYLVGACPGGTASNVITYLARGSVPLSVVTTLASTLIAPLATPAVFLALAGTRIHVSFFDMSAQVFWIVVFPLLDGLILRRLLRRHIAPWLPLFPALSIVTIAAVIACVVGLNQATILALPLAVAGAVVVHNVAGFGLGYGAARLCRCRKDEARAIAVEVGMQNSGLGVALAKVFLSAQAALPGAIFSLEQNLAGIALARFWTRSDARARRNGAPSA